MALTIVVLCSGVAFWLWPRGEGVSVPAPSAPAETASTPRGGSSRALLSVRLTPGLGKNTVPPRAQVSPPPGGRVSLMFELPGVHSPTDCQIFLTLAGSGSSRNTAWFSDPVTSRASSAGQEVRVEVPSSRFSKADYVAEVRSPRGEVLETYAFRVSR